MGLHLSLLTWLGPQVSRSWDSAPGPHVEQPAVALCHPTSGFWKLGLDVSAKEPRMGL